MCECKKLSKCRECKNTWQRENRKKNGNIQTLAYEKRINGFLMRTYRNMKSRVLGLVKPHLYHGLSLLDKDCFYEWAKNNHDFQTLFTQWTNKGYDRKLSPSIDRIDPTKGYDITNIRWVTHSENSANTRRKKNA